MSSVRVKVPVGPSGAEDFAHHLNHPPVGVTTNVTNRKLSRLAHKPVANGKQWQQSLATKDAGLQPDRGRVA